MALLSTLTDTFPAGSIDAGKWDTDITNSGTIVQSGGQLVMTPGVSATGYQVLVSDTTYDITANAAFVEVPQVCTPSTYATLLNVTKPDYGDNIYMMYEGGFIHWGTWVGGYISGTAYNGTTHKYWRIREVGGSIFWDYSANGTSWSNFHSITNPFSMTSVLARLSVEIQTGSATPGASKFDNFNVVPTLHKPTNAMFFGANL